MTARGKKLLHCSFSSRLVQWNNIVRCWRPARGLVGTRLPVHKWPCQLTSTHDGPTRRARSGTPYVPSGCRRRHCCWSPRAGWTAWRVRPPRLATAVRCRPQGADGERTLSTSSSSTSTFAADAPSAACSSTHVSVVSGDAPGTGPGRPSAGNKVGITSSSMNTPCCTMPHTAVASRRRGRRPAGGPRRPSPNTWGARWRTQRLHLAVPLQRQCWGRRPVLVGLHDQHHIVVVAAVHGAGIVCLLSRSQAFRASASSSMDVKIVSPVLRWLMTPSPNCEWRLWRKEPFLGTARSRRSRQCMYAPECCVVVEGPSPCSRHHRWRPRACRRIAASERGLLL